MGAKRIGFSILAVVVLLLVAVRPMRSVNRTWQDGLAKWAPAMKASGQVVIVSIDDATIAKYGTWPWNRGQTARLFSAVAQNRAKVLIFDGWFPHRPDPLAGDSALSDTLRSIQASGTKIILPLEFRAPTNIPSADDTLPVEIPDLLRTSAFQLLPDKPGSDLLPILRSREVLFSDTIYQRWSSPTGFITSSADPEDDVFRNLGHVLKLGDEYFPSLAIAALAAYGDANLAEVSFEPGIVQVRNTVVPIDRIGQTPLRFLGPTPSVPMIDAGKLLENPQAFRQQLEGRIVMVGITSSAALNRESGDFFRTPIADRFPGVEIWAVGLENILQNRVPQRPLWARVWEFALGVSLLSVLWALTVRQIPIPTRWTVAGVGFLVLALLQFVVDRAVSVHTALDLPLTGALLGLIGFWALRPAPVKAVPLPSPSDSSPARTAAVPDDGIPRIGRFEIQGELGRGAMGVVHKGYDRSLDRHVAIKVISASRRLGEKQDESFARFEREARAIAKLNHPSIVTIHELGEWQDTSFIAMELLEGQSLEKLITTHRLSWKAVRLWGLQMMEALAYAHTSGVVHRDIKPANIMVVESGRRVKLTDFGLARQTDNSATLTQEGQVLGTPFYMAPEQIDGRKSEPIDGRTDGRSDQFSLGVVLYEMVARRKPYEGEDVRQVMLSILLHPHPPLAPLAPEDIPPQAVEVIETMMAKEAADRFATLDDTLEAWRRIPA
jgi:CHASE2 domain-containing sensor protein/tRNA A-37 threonylcarbamoyl transferase component Bud32